MLNVMARDILTSTLVLFTAESNYLEDEMEKFMFRSKALSISMWDNFRAVGKSPMSKFIGVYVTSAIPISKL